MPIDEEQPDVALEISNEAKRMIQGKLVSSGIVGALSLIPGVGAAVAELMTELAIQRTNNRVKEMFDHFTAKIREVGEERIDREWFRSEEFQTLLYEALQQLHVTHDSEKIEMLGVALANSGAPGFREEERKEIFIRFVRDLTRQHLKVLLSLAPELVDNEQNTWFVSFVVDKQAAHILRRERRWAFRPTLEPQDDDLLTLQMLHAYGLVEEHLVSSIEQPKIVIGPKIMRMSKDGKVRVRDEVETPVARRFRLSPLGDEFLKFMGLPKSQTQAESA